MNENELNDWMRFWDFLGTPHDNFTGIIIEIKNENLKTQLSSSVSKFYPNHSFIWSPLTVLPPSPCFSKFLFAEFEIIIKFWKFQIRRFFIYIKNTNSVEKVKTPREDKVAEFSAIGLILFSIHSPTSGILNSRALS